jgi:hypothetical protein
MKDFRTSKLEVCQPKGEKSGLFSTLIAGAAQRLFGEIKLYSAYQSGWIATSRNAFNVKLSGNSTNTKCLQI